MPLRTINDIFFRIAERDDRVVMMHRQAIQWVSISSQELYRNVGGVFHALRNWGIAKGDRVAILSENRPEWTIADFACQLLGATVVPIYATQTDEQSAFMLNDAGVKVIFVSSQKQLEKILAVQARTGVQHIVVMDGVETARATQMFRIMKDGPQGPDQEMEASGRTIGPADLATIIYTSGTTGTPKGAMLTHENLASNIAYSLKSFDVTPGEIMISFLPLSHVTARHVDLAMLYYGATLAYVPFVDQLPKALLEVRPTIFVGVPRVYEKVHTAVATKAAGFPKSLIYKWAIAVGRRHRAEIMEGKVPTSLGWRLANHLVFAPVQAGMGGRVHCYISGGAPLGRELAEWYADVGIRIHEGYGLTETSPVIAVNHPRAHKLGTVGKPLDNVEVRIAEDGEVLVRGPSVFKGYLNRPDETRNAFDGEWFRTGDIGNLDADGFLSITDRKKDLIKTSGGKFIAPQPLENTLKHNALIAEAVILGDKRKFPSVLIVPYFPLLEDWAKNNQISFASRAGLVANSQVKALYEGIVQDLNNRLARFEKLKRTLVVAEEFSAETGTLTASLKVRRREVEAHYRQQIDALYADAEKAGAVE
jgi:long-chain acyl-CoA synthetase